MSLGSISRPKRISDGQFIGDLMSLFKRHRIDSGEPAGPASFESCFASKDNFRSQLFTLCTAISHMSEDDLSGEQLLVLIGRALDVPEAADGTVDLPESMRAAFLRGYDAWSNRDLNESAPWPPVREPAANEPIPFPQPAATAAEPGATEKRAPEMHAPGMRTVQEALLMARKQAPFELPARSAPPAPAQGAAPVPTAASAPTPGVNIEDLTITELTKLLDDIEHRMSRIKPHFHSLAHSPEEALEQPAGMREIGETAYSKALIPAAQPGPSLVGPPTVSLSPIEPANIFAPSRALPVDAKYEEDSFLARHAYLRPGRRLPPDTIVPIPLAAPTSALAPMPMPMTLSVPVPVHAPVEATRVELPTTPTDILMALVANKPERFRVKIHLAIGVAAALILVASPLAGFVAYKMLHPTYVIEYPDVRPADQSSEAAAAPGSNPNSEPASSPTQKVAPKASAATSGPKTTHDARNPKTAKRTPPAPVAVWPPPPQR